METQSISDLLPTTQDHATRLPHLKMPLVKESVITCFNEQSEFIERIDQLLAEQTKENPSQSAGDFVRKHNLAAPIARTLLQQIALSSIDLSSLDITNAPMEQLKEDATDFATLLATLRLGDDMVHLLPEEQQEVFSFEHLKERYNRILDRLDAGTEGRTLPAEDILALLIYSAHPQITYVTQPDGTRSERIEDIVAASHDILEESITWLMEGKKGEALLGIMGMVRRESKEETLVTPDLAQSIEPTTEPEPEPTEPISTIVADAPPMADANTEPSSAHVAVPVEEPEKAVTPKQAEESLLTEIPPDIVEYPWGIVFMLQILPAQVWDDHDKTRFPFLTDHTVFDAMDKIPFVEDEALWKSLPEKIQNDRRFYTDYGQNTKYAIGEVMAAFPNIDKNTIQQILNLRDNLERQYSNTRRTHAYVNFMREDKKPYRFFIRTRGLIQLVAGELQKMYENSSFVPRQTLTEQPSPEVVKKTEEELPALFAPELGEIKKPPETPQLHLTRNILSTLVAAGTPREGKTDLTREEQASLSSALTLLRTQQLRDEFITLIRPMFQSDIILPQSTDSTLQRYEHLISKLRQYWHGREMEGDERMQVAYDIVSILGMATHQDRSIAHAQVPGLNQNRRPVQFSDVALLILTNHHLAPELTAIFDLPRETRNLTQLLADIADMDTRLIPW